VQVKPNGTSFFQRAVLQLFLGGGGLILLTFICFRAGLNVPTVGFAYLILVSLLCVMGSFVVSVRERVADALPQPAIAAGH
jgi:ABC-type transport system involved in multi-copper enzyme maturation permease subunit